MTCCDIDVTVFGHTWCELRPPSTGEAATRRYWATRQRHAAISQAAVAAYGERGADQPQPATTRAAR